MSEFIEYEADATHLEAGLGDYEGAEKVSGCLEMGQLKARYKPTISRTYRQFMKEQGKGKTYTRMTPSTRRCAMGLAGYEVFRGNIASCSRLIHLIMY